MKRVEAHITVECANELQHLNVSTLLKTICHALQLGTENQNSGNRFAFKITGGHVDAVTEYVGSGREGHPLRKAFGL